MLWLYNKSTANAILLYLQLNKSETATKNRQGLLPAAVVFIPCKLYPHLQFLSHYYEYYSFSVPTISYRCFKLFSSSISCNNPANDKTPYWLQSVSTGCNVNMVFLRATRYYFLLTNHSIYTIKGNEQNLIKILSKSYQRALWKPWSPWYYWGFRLFQFIPTRQILLYGTVFSMFSRINYSQIC